VVVIIRADDKSDQSDKAQRMALSVFLSLFRTKGASNEAKVALLLLLFSFFFVFV
jgi:hypothetical protein